MSIAIGFNSPYSTVMTNIKNSPAAEKLESNLKTNIEDATDKELMDVCKSFETYFVEQVFKEMKKTVPVNEEENEYLSYFGDMLNQKYAENITDNGSLGIAQLLYESMKRN